MPDKSPAERRAERTAKVLADMKLKRAKAVKPKRDRSSLQYVYFIRSEWFVKIGWATSMETRLNSCQVNNPHPVELLALMVGGVDEETMLHAHFHSDHHRGEWFRLSDGIQSLVDEIMLLNPIDARVRAGEWFVRNAGSRALLMFSHEAEALRKREEDTANLVDRVTVVLPDHSISAEKVL
jgi:hypothetical protein